MTIHWPTGREAAKQGHLGLGDRDFARNLMKKRYALLRRQADIGASEFRHRWLAVGRNFEDKGACVQNHLRGVGDVAPLWDGIGEFEPEADQKWLARERFVDQARSVIVDGSTFVANGGPQKGVKFLTLTRRSPRYDRREFSEYWRVRHVEVLRGLPGFSESSGPVRSASFGAR